MMKTQLLLAASLASVCLLVSGDLSRPVLAQQNTPSSQVPRFECDAQSMSSDLRGGVFLTTLQGDVKLKIFGVPSVSFTSDRGYLVLKTPIVAPGLTPRVVRVPMEAATMKVSITALGTVFEDAKNDKLTVELNPTS